MSIKPEHRKYVPLFEEHTLINSRFGALPARMRYDIAKIFAVDENAILSGQMADYLTGQDENQPDEIEIVVGDASKFRGNECCGEYDAAQRQETEAEQLARVERGTENELPIPGNIIVIQLDPDGKIIEPGQDEVHEEEEAAIINARGGQFESYDVAGLNGSVMVYESCKAIHTLPISLGSVTVLITEPGVMSEYRHLVTNAKNSKSTIKYDKAPKVDQKQSTVIGNADLQNTPK